MRAGTIAGLLSWGAPLPSDRRLIKILDFLGVPYTNLDLSCKTFDASEAQSDGLRPIASAVTIRHALSAGAPATDVIRSLFRRAPAAFIHSITPERLSAVELNSLIDGVAVPAWVEPTPESCYRVSSGYRDVCETFSGLTWKPASWKERVPAIECDPQNLETLVAVDACPVFARSRKGTCDLFLLCGQDVADLDEVVRENFDVHSHFLELFPHMMFIRHAFSSACWQPGKAYGSLIIDDPPLRTHYGFLNFRRLVRAMDDVGFSTDIALIPWNFRRTQPSVAALINERRGRLGVCIHGCDHTRSEYGANDQTQLAKLTMIGIERMEAHRRDHGVDYERIMVFPQGVFSESAMEVLKSFDFLAAVNTEVVPSHNTSRAGAVALADVLAPAITRYNGFPLFPRRQCSDNLVNFAADIFVGKPCLLGAHHTDFVDGGQTLIDLIAKIRTIAPRLQWSSLGTTLRRTHLWRRGSDGSQWIRMFASEISVTGDSSSECQVLVLKTESERQRVQSVFVDGQKAKFGWDGVMMTIPIELRPGQSTTVRVAYHNPFAGADARLGARYRFRASVRRCLCDIRDNYVAVGRQGLRRLWL